VQAAPHCPPVTVPALHVPVELQVCFAVPEHWVVPGTQVPIQPLVEHAEFWQGTGVPQDPEALHVWRLLPEQLRLFGVQLPVHSPPLQTYLQAVPVVGNFPVESQVTGMFPLQVLSTPGIQTAPHCPGVMDPLVQVPWLLHVCGVVPEHWVAPGVQVPEQAPFTHAWFVHGRAVPQAPLASQFCTALPAEAHFVAPGAHVPEHTPLTHVWLVQACEVPHVPAESQVCTPLPVAAHFTAPGEHTPVQAPLAQA
jgi:hypothetical protein